MSDLHTCGYSYADPHSCAACRQEAMPSARARANAYEAMRRSDADFDRFMRTGEEAEEVSE